MSDRKRALVTGASAGIGRAIASALASRGHDLVLTARREDRLRELAVELRERHGVDVRVIADDLGDPGAPQRIFDATEGSGVAIDVLVNNAGYGVPGSYLSVEWETHREFLAVLVTAVCHLTHLYLPGMVARGYGRILQVASVAGFLPGTAGHTLYGASKAFLIRMSESLAHEVEDQGVHVTALCPGFTHSEFHDRTGTRDMVSKFPTWMWRDAETVAREGVDAVMRGDVVYVNGVANRVLCGLSRHLPRRLADGLARRQSRKFRRR